jgi:glyoxylase-like metal-dependent hydrolase (beta-lactamase superfamily II)
MMPLPLMMSLRFCMSVRYSWRLLRAGEFRLDGGSMFGLIPRTVWSRSVETDDKGRIRVQHNCLLLERKGDVPADWKGPAPKVVLLEVGTGNKLDAKSRELFALDGRSILDALHEVSCNPEDVGGVLVTHLHFDHAGGLTRVPRAGEQADWVGTAGGMAGARPDHGVKRTFPNATIFVQKREWEDAIAQRSVMTRTYFADHVQAVDSQTKLIDSPAPFEVWRTPERTEMPLLTFEQRATEVLPGLFVLRVPGHTWGQQAMLFTDEAGQTIAFTPDVMPTAAHLGAAYSLAYDVEPYTSMVSKHWLLSHAAEKGWTLCLDHEPGHPLKQVKRNEKGWFELVDA